MKTTETEKSETDELLRAVADEQRRAVLQTLSAADGDILDYETLIERVLDRLRPADATLPRSEHRARVRISLYHTHLPKLADNGLVANDSERKRVQNRTDERIKTLLDCVESL